jgi:pimeloyl-ACP methyl ester carboxylesterase
MTQPAVTFTTIDGLKTAELILPGSANAPANPRTILMLHGWGVSLKLMQPLGEKLAALGYSIYIPDMPGFGGSAPPAVAWTVPDYAKFVVAYLDAHQLDRVYLIGHSFGGRVGLVLGAEYPERFIKFALADAAGIPPKPSSSTNFRLTTYKAVRDGLYKVGAKNLADNLRAKYNARYGSDDFKAASGIMRETFVKVVNQDLRPYVQHVKPATLLFWGDKDEDTPLWMGQELEKLIPDAGLIVYEGAGHYSYLEHLSETVKTVDYFFKQEKS